MANKHIKEEYLNTLSPIERVLLGDIFKQAVSLENKHGKDCAYFDAGQVAELFHEYSAPSKEQLEIWCELLDKYATWFEAFLPDNPPYFGAYAAIPVVTPKSPMSEKKEKWEIDYDKIISSEEIEEIHSKLSNVHDKMLIQAIYEGFHISEHIHDWVYLSSSNCNQEENTVTFKSGRQLVISPKLMKILLECASNIEYDINSRTMTLPDNDNCFKHLRLTETMTQEDIIGTICRRLYTIKTRENIPKLTIYHLRVSGYFNSLIALGITEGFHRYSLLRDERVKQTAQRYDINTTAGYAYYRAVRRCMKKND